MTDKLSDIGTEAIKASPPMAVIGAEAVTNIPMQGWVYGLTVVYLGLQIAWLVFKWWKASRMKDWRPE